jgi:hypothetical protein
MLGLLTISCLPIFPPASECGDPQRLQHFVPVPVLLGCPLPSIGMRQHLVDGLNGHDHRRWRLLPLPFCGASVPSCSATRTLGQAIGKPAGTGRSSDKGVAPSALTSALTSCSPPAGFACSWLRAVGGTVDTGSEPSVGGGAPRAAWATPRVLAVDDFSFRKGRTFSTLLLDLERRVPIDLLPGAVYNYLHMDQPPERRSPQDRRSRPLDRYKPYLLQRWNEGIRNSRQLWRELRAQGYQQSSGPVQRFIGPLRQPTGKPHKFKAEAAAPLYRPEEVRQRPLAALQAARLLTSKEDQRTTWQQTYLTRLLAAEPSLKQTYHQVQTFCEMVRHFQGERLDQWLAEIQTCAVAELRACAQGLLKDYEAVKSGLALPWSNGPTEGHIHKLKLLKRQMYGRASFVLLRHRVLHSG